MSSMTQGVGGSLDGFGLGAGNTVIQAGNVANASIVAGQEGGDFSQGLAAATQGAGGIVGGNMGSQI